MAKDTFVGRQVDVEKISKVLLGENRARGSLSVMSIEGPGGIGKTAAFDHALAVTHLAPRRFLTLRVASRDNLRDATPFGVVESLVASAQAPGVEKRAPGAYFPATRQALDAVAEVRRPILVEVDKRFPGDVELRAAVLKAVDLAFAQGRPLAEFGQTLKKLEEFRESSKRLEPQYLDKVLRTFRSVRPQSKPLFGLLPGGASVELRNALKQDSLKVLADALASDLAGIFAGKRKLDGVERLLLVVDDYEFLMEHFGELLVRHLLPALRQAAFPTAAFIVGRDKLVATHPYWNKELADCIVDRISLGPLALPEFVELCRVFGVAEAAQRDAIWKETSGYPFLVKLLLEEIAERKSEGLDGPSALMLRSFYERTTRFMSDEQRGWLECVLFLPDVNKRSLKAYFADRPEIDRVQEWFEREPSIRDPNSAALRVRPQLADRLKAYLQRRDPDRFDALSAKATAA